MVRVIGALVSGLKKAKPGETQNQGTWLSNWARVRRSGGRGRRERGVRTCSFVVKEGGIRAGDCSSDAGEDSPGAELSQSQVTA